MIVDLQPPSFAMTPSRIRLNATSATEQKIPLARMYQGDRFVLEFAIENLVSEQGTHRRT